MLVIKLKRIGKKHQAAFRLIVDEKRHKVFGKNVEDLGWYNPRGNKLEVNKDRVLYWLKTGAKPTDTVHNLLISASILTGKKIAVHKSRRSKKEVGTSTAGTSEKLAEGVPAAPAAEKPIGNQ